MKGKTQQAAAAASDMSERSVRNWNKGPLPSEKKDRRRKSTRPDPFAGVWAEEVEPLLQADVDRILAAPTVLEWLDERHPGRSPSMAPTRDRPSVTGLPKRVSSPDVGFRNPQRTESRVVLPEPFGPSSPKTLPVGISIETPSSA